MRVFAFAFLISLVISYLITPLFEKLGFKFGAVDVPDEKRKIHLRPVPRIGGVAIYIATLVTLIASYQYIEHLRIAYLYSPNYREMVTILVGASLAGLVGLADDFRSLSPMQKFIGQLAASSLLLFFGLGIDFLVIPFMKGPLVLGWWSIPITIFWMVAMMNIINFIDGLDGLAAGVAAISGMSFFFYLIGKGQLGMALLSIILVGSCLGFLRYNFYPARIFMGDSGSMFIGYFLGGIAIQGVMKSMAAMALLVPIVIMGVPIIDAFFAIVRRYLSRQPLTVADKNHIHHRLLHRGLGHRGAVVLIYIWSGVLAIAGYSIGLLPSYLKWASFVVLSFLSVLVLLYTGLIDELRIVLKERAESGEREK